MVTWTREVGWGGGDKLAGIPHRVDVEYQGKKTGMNLRFLKG